MNLAVAHFESGQFCSDAQPALANDTVSPTAALRQASAAESPIALPPVHRRSGLCQYHKLIPLGLLRHLTALGLAGLDGGRPRAAESSREKRNQKLPDMLSSPREPASTGTVSTIGNRAHVQTDELAHLAERVQYPPGRCWHLVLPPPPPSPPAANEAAN